MSIYEEPGNSRSDGLYAIDFVVNCVVGRGPLGYLSKNLDVESPASLYRRPVRSGKRQCCRNTDLSISQCHAGIFAIAIGCTIRDRVLAAV